MTAIETRSINVMGDEIRIRWDGNVWVSPCNGRQHARAIDAMRDELERYYADCGEDTEDEATAAEIDRYAARVVR